MQRLVISILIILLGNASLAPAQDDLVDGFKQPPLETKPWCYYYWLSDQISKEGITADLEAMAQVGIGEALIGNIFVEEIPLGPVPILSEEWWKLTEHAIREGTRLGVNIGMFNSPGWSQSGGPWVSKDQSMRYLAASEIHLQGPTTFHGEIAAPHPDFQDVALIAFPEPSHESDTLTNTKITIAGRDVSSELLDGNLQTKAAFSSIESLAGKPVVIDVAFPESKTVRSLLVSPADDPFFANCKLYVEEAGEYRLVDQVACDWRKQALSVGFIRQAPLAISFPAVRSKRFRIEFHDIQYGHKNFIPAVGASLAELRLLSAARVDQYIEKQLGKMLATPEQRWDAYHWRESNEPLPNSTMVSPINVQQLPKITTPEGKLTWQVPAGNWIVQRIGMVPTGMTNSPAVPHGRGLEIDKMSGHAAKKHFDAFVGKIIKRMPPEDRHSLKRLVIDSYEAGAQNWTDDMAEKFQQRYGYDPIPWLPVISGHVVASADQSDRFLWDVRRLIADRIAGEYVPGLRDAGRAHGLELWMQNYGHWGYPAEFLSYGRETDRVSGEFWVTGTLGSTECRAASSLAAIYGKKFVSAESYTGGPSFLSTPQSLKARGDWSFTQGINHVVLHVYIQQSNNKVPGLNAPWGTEFNRHNTWFKSAREWILYQQRACWMLQQGHRVADVAYFIGENTPVLSGPTQPMLPQGYDFDWINADALLHLADVENGDVVLPHGTRYRVLVLPNKNTMTPELLVKIQSLVKRGATIVGLPPSKSPSLSGFPKSDQTIQAISKEMWGDKIKPFTTYGEGRIFTGVSLEEVFSKIELRADFAHDSKLLYTHRKSGSDDIYFVSNPTPSLMTSEVSFRVTGKAPEYWWPHRGLIERPAIYKISDRNTSLPLRLEANQSVFVVFRKTPDSPSIVNVSPNTDESLHTVVRNNHWQFSSTNGGTLDLTDSTGASHQIQLVSPAEPMMLRGPWEVSFSSQAKSPPQRRFEKLIDLAKHDDPDIRHFSGSTTYQISFDARTKRETMLDLGQVESLAEITLNGKSFPTLWTAPWLIDVTEALEIGKNHLSITVTNAWNNRLVGDAFLNENERSTTIALPSVTTATPTVPAGLLGPVRLMFPVETSIPFAP